MKFNLDRIRDVATLAKELAIGLSKLDFTNNFQSFETTVEIAATTEAKIDNELAFIPTRYIVVSQTDGGLITKGTTSWTNQSLYLYNNGASTATITVIFFK